MDSDLSKLTVVKLRQELAARGLDTKGYKAALIDRLREALDQENGKESQNTSAVSAGAGGDTTYEDNALDESNRDYDQGEEEEEAQAEDENEENIQSEYGSSKEQKFSESMEQEESKPSVKEEGGKEKAGYEVKAENVEIKQEKTDGYEETNDNKENSKLDVKTEIQTDIKDEKQDQRSRKRKRSPSPAKDQRRSTGTPPVPRAQREFEPDFDANAVLLSWYDSDLNFVIDKDNFTKGSNMCKEGFDGFEYIWAGTRATYGFNSGKVCFEVKPTENNKLTIEDEPDPHVLRVGWSVATTSMQLGEEPLSYGYGGTGKASTNCKFINYGKPFVIGDVITAYLDFDSSPDQVIMSFSLNGEDLGSMYTIPTSVLEGKALFPHLLTKNISFEINFGQQETPWFPKNEDFTWASQVPIENRVAGPARPEKKSDCEAIMMCGLPGSGKTVWATEFASQNIDKYFNILGTNNLIDKMKVMGLPRKRNYAGRWDVLIDKSTKCLNKLLQEACLRRRNFIIDQTNVYPSAQKRKMRNFDGFTRRAVVIVPTDEEFKRRVAKREAEEGKDVPDSAVLEMKANFRLPEKGDIFTEVQYIELQEAEARKLVDKYNKEGRDAGYGQQQNQFGNKRFRPNERSPYRGGGGGGFRGGHRGFERKDHRNGKPPFRSGPPSLMRDRHRSLGGGGGSGGGGGGWQGRGGPGDRGMGGGWRDRMNRSQPGGGGGGGGGYGRQGGNDHRNSMGGGGGGGWRGGGAQGGRGGGGRDSYGGDRQRGGSGGGGGGSGGGYDRNRGGQQHNRNQRDMKGGQVAKQGAAPAQQQQASAGQGGNQSGGQWGGYSQGGQSGSWGWGQQQQQQQQPSYNQTWNQNYSQQGYNQGYGQQQPQAQQQQQGYGQGYNQNYGSGNNPYGNWQQQYYGQNQPQQQQQYGQGWSQGWQGYGYGGYGNTASSGNQQASNAQTPAK